LLNMCTCNNNSSCSCGSLITTSKGNTGATGPQGPQGNAGTNGTNGVLDWGDYDLSCWVSNGITEGDATNDEITQDFIDAFCAVHQVTTNAISATDDYVFTDKNTVLNINPITNDLFFPTVTITLGTVVNGTATVSGNTIIFTPATNFVGTAVIPYTITDADSDTSSANVYVNVIGALTTEAIETTVENTLITLLSSDEYWDIGLPIGTKLLLSNSNLGDFTTTGITAGKGITGTKWAKWAICNGNLANGVDDFRLRNLRGFDYADGAGNDVAGFKAGSDTKSIDITNLPPHRHKYTFFSPQYTDARDINAWKVIQAPIGNYDVSHPGGELGSSQRDGDNGHYINMANTGDGTNNINDQDELQSTPDPVDVTNAYVTVIVVQKIA
jgi:hypothetical protein